MRQPERGLIEFLEARSAFSADHTGRTLVDHLVGTYELLAQWGADEDVCNAGLFHSIYGTPDYLHKSLPTSERLRLRQLIGLIAEELVFEFARLGHRGSLLLCDPSNSVEIRSEIRPKLLHLCAANFLEQSGSLDPNTIRHLVIRDLEYWKLLASMLGGTAGDRIAEMILACESH